MNGTVLNGLDSSEFSEILYNNTTPDKFSIYQVKITFKVAPYRCRAALYRSVWSFADRQMFWNERHMKSCVLRFFYGEITKCSVHGKKFVKPKQYVCFQLFFSVFRPRFRKLLHLLILKCFSYVELKFYHVSNDFMDFSLDYPLFPSVNFFKTTSSCYTISKVRHIQI